MGRWGKDAWRLGANFLTLRSREVEGMIMKGISERFYRRGRVSPLPGPSSSKSAICTSSRTYRPLPASGSYGASKERTQAVYKLPFHPRCLGTTRREVCRGPDRANSRILSRSTPPRDQSLLGCSTEGTEGSFRSLGKANEWPPDFRARCKQCFESISLCYCFTGCSRGQEENRPL